MKNMAKRRNFEALEYEKQEKQARLTPKQYLVYSYLMSISKWDAQTKEDHYYVYKNSFTIIGAAAAIGISRPTWRTAIEKLESIGYIQDRGDHYRIRLQEPYAPLHIELIKYLLPYGKTISNVHAQGGNIIALYSLIYKYWQACENSCSNCEITINQLRTLFKAERDENTTKIYKMMMGVFITCGLMSITIKSKDSPNGKPYPIYKINYVRLELPPTLEQEEQAPGNIDNILDKIKLNIEEFEEPIDFK